MLSNEFDVIPRSCDFTLIIENHSLSSIHFLCIKNVDGACPRLYIYFQSNSKYFKIQNQLDLFQFTGTTYEVKVESIFYDPPSQMINIITDNLVLIQCKLNYKVVVLDFKPILIDIDMVSKKTIDRSKEFQLRSIFDRKLAKSPSKQQQGES